MSVERARWRRRLVLAALVGSCTFPDVNITPPPPEDDGVPPECIDDCAESTNPCFITFCENDRCEEQRRGLGSPCLGDFYCDGNDECVECLDHEHCGDDTLLCSDGACVLEHCTNDMPDADETGQDCGGADCAPCGIDGGCMNDDDCMPQPCDLTIGQCALCTDHDQCAPGYFCCMAGDDCAEEGHCELRREDTVVCSEDYMCNSSECADGLCCREPCDGVCYSCANNLTGHPSGECHPIMYCTDDNEPACNATNTCNGNGQCNVLQALCL